MRLEQRWRSGEWRPLGEAAQSPRQLCGLPMRDSMFSSFEGTAKEYLGGGRSARTAAESIGFHAWSFAQPSNRSQCQVTFLVSVTNGINLWEVRPLQSKSRRKKKLLWVLNGSHGFLCGWQLKALRAFFHGRCQICRTGTSTHGPCCAAPNLIGSLPITFWVLPSPSQMLSPSSLPGRRVKLCRRISGNSPYCTLLFNCMKLF